MQGWQGVVCGGGSDVSVTSGAGLCGLKWNPTSPDLLAVSLSSGGVYVLEVKEDVKVLASKTDMGATSCELCNYTLSPFVEIACIVSTLWSCAFSTTQV